MKSSLYADLIRQVRFAKAVGENFPKAFLLPQLSIATRQRGNGVIRDDYVAATKLLVSHANKRFQCTTRLIDTAEMRICANQTTICPRIE